MGPDVVVEHCTLTVRGHGGWSWGTDSSQYLAAAIPAIEQALERVLREIEADPEADVTVDEPLLLTWLPDGTMPDHVRHRIVETIDAAVASAGAATSSGTASGPAPAEPRAPDTPPAAQADWLPDPAGTVAAVLALWSQSGRLEQILSSWPVDIVEQWVQIMHRAAGAPGRPELNSAAVASIAGLGMAESGPPVRDTAPAARRLLVLLGALAAAAGGVPVGAATFEDAVRLVPGAAAGALPPPEARAAQPVRAVDEPKPADGRTSKPAGREPSAPLPRRLVVPGLPFLVLVQLGRIGYLDALVAAAAATGAPEAAQLVAAGLAGKVLPPPERGWRRRPAEVAAVAAASGLAADVVDAAAHAGQREVQQLLAPLQSALTALYAAGRAAGDEVVVTATADGAVCGETEGALPIAWLGKPAEIDHVLDQLGSPPVRRDNTFARLAASLGPRSAFPHLDLPDLERHTGAAAGAALGSLAGELWPPTANAPLLALERLDDLEVELRFESVLAVAVPRGQRWLDLRRAGLLDHWVVPWADGGRWELVTW